MSDFKYIENVKEQRRKAVSGETSIRCIFITFRHSRDIFIGDRAKAFLVHNFKKGFRFEGCEEGRYFPTISVTLTDFIAWKNTQPVVEFNKIVRIEGVFSFMQTLSFGVRSFVNDLRN